MLSRDGFPYGSTPTAPVKSINSGEAAGKPDSLTSCTILTQSIGTLGEVFSIYSEAESVFMDAIHAANLDKGISGRRTDFHLRKERLLILLHLLKNCPDLDEQQTLSVRDTVLDDKDKRKALQLLKGLAKGKGTRRAVFWKGKEVMLPNEEAMWRDSNEYASSLSDSRFLSYVKSFPDASFLHDAIVKCEEAAYACLRTQIDSLVSQISQKILLVQEEACNKQVRCEVKNEEEMELKVSRAEFVRNIEDLCRERSKS